MTLLASLNGLDITFLKTLAPALKVIACTIIDAALELAFACIVLNALDGFCKISPSVTAGPPVAYAPPDVKVSAAPVIIPYGDVPAIPCVSIARLPYPTAIEYRDRVRGDLLLRVAFLRAIFCPAFYLAIQGF
jgi:hypothetical protein